MHLSIAIALSALAASTAADFLISNSTVCMGAFPFSTCYAGVAVLSGKDSTKDYTCPQLYTAEDENYVNDGAFGSPQLHADGGICKSGSLKFVQGDTGYMVTDKDDKHVADCRIDTDLKLEQHCSQWLGSISFRSAYYCTSGICD